MALTVKQLESLRPGQWVSDRRQHGAGVLAARRLRADSVRFYFRYVDGAGKRDALPIGVFDRGGQRGLTLAEAHARAGELSRRYMTGEKNLRAVLDSEARLEAMVAEKEAREREGKPSSTLGALLDAYAEQLETDGKYSAREVRSSVALHIQQPWPMLWTKAAAEIETREVLEVVARLVEQGKRRQADKLRGWIRAAYSTAIQAHMDVSYSQRLRDLDIWSNPARDLAIVKGSRRVRDRVLTVSEFRAYWRHINEMQNCPWAAVLRFHVLTGGQRPRQLFRVCESDFDESEGYLVIHDGKGRREQPRRHIVPVIPAALNELRAMDGGKAGPHLVTVSMGRSGADESKFIKEVAKISETMVSAGELDEAFTPGAIRTTVETRLAAAKFSREVRGQLQSHGLSGVQDRHYDMYDYFDEKRSALSFLYKLLAS